MLVRRSLIPLVLALFAARCADGPHPTAVQQPLTPAPHFVQWAGGSAPQFTATGALSGGGGGVKGLALASMAGGLSLVQNTASFWAVRGQSRSVQLNYLSAFGDSTQPFLLLTITDPDSAPGVGAFAVGDSVLVTVTVDTAKIGASREPTGLLFGEPAQLQIAYGGAAGDLNGAGVLDEPGAYIASQMLQTRYRHAAD